MLNLKTTLNDLVAKGLSEIARKAVDTDISEKYGCEINNAVFAMHPYCWCGEGDCPWCSLDSPKKHEYGGEENGLAPCFWYKPLNIQITWYKYIGRGMQSNRVFSVKDWGLVVEDCLNQQSQEANEI